MLLRMENLVLPADLEQFAAEAVGSGQYRDTIDLVRTGLDLVRRRDKARTGFIASLEAAQLDGIIQEEERTKA